MSNIEFWTPSPSSELLHTDSLMLFESEEPSTEEIVETFEFYADDKLRELGVDTKGITTDGVVTWDESGWVSMVTFDILGTTYRVVVREWDLSQGVAIPIVELRRG